MDILKASEQDIGAESIHVLRSEYCVGKVLVI